VAEGTQPAVDRPGSAHSAAVARRAEPGAAEPPLRADALRNRRVLLDTAATVLAEQGLDVSVAYIARQAGIGKATAFRRFPTKESLIVAVVEDRLSELVALEGELVAAPDAGAALRDFIAAGAALVAENRGVCEVMYGSLGNAEVFAAYGRIVEIMRRLLDRAQRAGAVRDDITAEDLVLLQRGIAQTAAPLRSSDPDLWRRYLDLLWDGLRPGARSPLSGTAPVFPEIGDGAGTVASLSAPATTPALPPGQRPVVSEP
jgi:AcrR family transcriptional regulator